MVQRGFTLLEVLIVVFILGMVAAVAIPTLSSTDPYKLELAAEEVAQAMRFARSEAMRSGNPYGFTQQATPKRIRIFQADTPLSTWSPSYDVYDPVSRKLYDIDLDMHPFASADAVSLVAQFRGSCNVPDTIYFDVNGVPWCTFPKTVPLTQLDLTVTLGADSRLVTLYGHTGRVSIQ